MLDDVDFLAALWLFVHLAAVIVIALNLHDAVQKQRVVKQLNGPARELQVKLDIIKDALRLVGTVAFAAAAIPVALIPDAILPTVALLFMGATVKVVTSLIDRHGRKRLLRFTEQQIAAERAGQLNRMEDTLNENTELTREIAARGGVE